MTAFHELRDGFLIAGAVSSVLHSVLPPWDWEVEALADFPNAQRIVIRLVRNRWYKLLIYICGYIAFNARSSIWRSISMPQQVRKHNARMEQEPKGTVDTHELEA
jgi:hypothetical protein